MVKLLQRFGTCMLANVHLEAKCDSDRKEELLLDGLRVGEGLVFDCNACLIDSLLQCMASAGLLDPLWAGDGGVARRARRQTCGQVRLHLARHDDLALRPVCRDNLGNVEIADEVEHENAYLQHDIHGIPIVLHLLQLLGEPNHYSSAGFEIRAYTRFDCKDVEPAMLSIHYGGSGSLNTGKHVLTLYNNTGHGVVGYHYDPVFEASRGRGGSGGGAAGKKLRGEGAAGLGSRAPRVRRTGGGRQEAPRGKAVTSRNPLHLLLHMQ